MELWASGACLWCWAYFKYWDCWRSNFFLFIHGEFLWKMVEVAPWPLPELLRCIVDLLYWLPWWSLHTHRATKYWIILCLDAAENRLFPDLLRAACVTSLQHMLFKTVAKGSSPHCRFCPSFCLISTFHEKWTGLQLTPDTIQPVGFVYTLCAFCQSQCWRFTAHMNQQSQMFVFVLGKHRQSGRNCLQFTPQKASNNPKLFAFWKLLKVSTI